MSIVADLREALQDVVTPDLKAVVRGLADLKEEVRSSNALLREEMQSGSALLRREVEQAREESNRNIELLRREIEQSREQARENTAVLREDTRQHIAQLREEARAYEVRSIERAEHLHGALKLALVTQRLVDAEKQLEQMRGAQQPQQQ